MAKGSTKMRRGSREVPMSFQGKKVLITGSSRGIGRGIALKLAGKGARRGSLLSQPGGSGGDIRKNPQTWV